MLREIELWCNHCQRVNTYSPAEYVGEFFICKNCRQMVYLRDIYHTLSRETITLLEQDRITRAIIHQIEEELEESGRL